MHFTRSAAHAASKVGVRLCTICPQFVDTSFLTGIKGDMLKYINRFGSLLSPELIVDAMVEMVIDESKSGVARVIMQV